MSENRASLPRRRTCHECGVTVLGGDGGIRAWGRLFCSEECADDYENRPTSQEIGDMYPEWSGSVGTNWDGA